ncbi:MAG: primosomal protein DnaI, partial [Streptococcaceae bacterium]|nr:primosomal protein DnaI [Streptococcaceae bacterium]MCL2681807.1 primosomal protein DnaI [Streptococcaceae bacterium]
MESIGDILSKRPEVKGNLQSLMVEVMKNQDVQAFIKEHEMTEDQIQRSYSKFYEYVKELEKIQNKQERMMDGYQPVLIMNHDYADVSYETTEELAERQKIERVRRRVNVIGLPKTYRDITLEDVSSEDSKRLELIQSIVKFASEPTKEKGLYLYGNFGVGKSYIMAAMANELAQKGISTTLLHYPTFISDIDFNNAREVVNDIKKAPVLVLDDIGAEMNNAWVRDSILQVILQYRMQE